jgi:hypothetical protein
MTTAARRVGTTGSALAAPAMFKLIEELILLCRL